MNQNTIRFKPFKKQKQFMKSVARRRALFAGKRGGKTEPCCLEAIRFTEEQRGYRDDGDPYLGLICAPTNEMLVNTTLQKFNKFARVFGDPDHDPNFYHKTKKLYQWPNGSLIQCAGADKPQRIEGKKAYWAWIDEAQQVSEQFFLEILARTSDTRGSVWLTASLGLDFNYPKGHWLYQHFVRPSSQLVDSRYWIWNTDENIYYPKDELEDFKRTLDIKTYKLLFEFDWNLSTVTAVYSDLDATNELDHQYNPDLETAISIDWGWNHPMAVGFFQYDPKKNHVYLFDEIVQSGLTLDALFKKIKDRGYTIHKWYCDAAGKQTREQSGISNVAYFRKHFGISFNYRNTAISYGIPIVRSFIRNGLGQAQFFISPSQCPKSWDQMKNYRYAEKDGIISEKPTERDDDCPDMIRYYFVNRHDIFKGGDEFENLDRWGNF